MKKTTAAVLVCSVMFACAVIFTAVLATAAEDKPSLYLNDSVWYKGSRFMLTKVYEEYFVPVSIFTGFDYIDVNVDVQRREVLLNNKTTGHFVSFNAESSLAITDAGEESYIRIYRFYEGEYYVPADYVCGILGVSNEVFVSPVDGEYSMRIYDADAKKTFDELITANNPDALPAQTETVTEETTSAVKPPQEETTEPDTSATDPTGGVECDIMLLLDTRSDNEVYAALKCLSDNGINASFIYNGAASDAAYVTLYAAGYPFVLTAKNGTLPAEQNKSLSALTKTKTRLVCQSYGDEFDGDFTAALKENAYAVIKPDYYTCDITAPYLSSASDDGYVIINTRADENSLVKLTELVKLVSANANIRFIYAADIESER